MVKYQLLQTIYSLNLTESTINHAVTKIAKAFGPIYQEMISELKKRGKHTRRRDELEVERKKLLAVDVCWEMGCNIRD